MKKLRYVILIALVGLPVIFTGIFSVQAQSIEELQQSINQKANERKALEAEAARITNELTKVGAEKGVLTKELNRINAERKSLDNTIKQTQNEIDQIDLTINKTEKEISQYNNEIRTYGDAVAALLRGVQRNTSVSFLEVLASAEDFSDFFNQRDTYLQLQAPLLDTTRLLQQKKIDLHKSNELLTLEQQELAEQQSILDDQRSIVKSKEDEQQEVLNATKNKESAYQKSLQDTLKMIAALDAEVRNFESKLEFALNPSALPQKGSSVFAWPLDSVLITQRFGKTVSSQQLYVSGSHSGVDFRAAVGTPVYAVADGIVRGIGDTDLTCPRASFGKWVFIEHTGIGLSTTYGHLSAWKVAEGQSVKQGDLIAYSGNSGHSTAPHLHLSTYATKGVNGEEGARVTEKPSAACAGKNYRMPLAPTAAYLDALAYLPATDASFFKHN